MGSAVRVLGLMFICLLATSGVASASDFVLPVGSAPAGTAREDASISGKAPYTLGGVRWRGRTIKVVDKTKGRITGKVFNAAIRSWNKSGARIRFKKVKRSHGRHIEVTTERKINGGQGGGKATLGYFRPGSSIVFWPLGDCNVPANFAKRVCPGSKVVRMPRGGGHVWFQKVSKADGKENFSQFVRVAVHELGHTLGLKHNNTECLTMNTHGRSGCSYSVADAAKTNCISPRRGDAQGVVKRYGGRNRVKNAPKLCDKFPKPGAPSIQLTGTLDDGRSLSLSVTSGRMPPPYAQSNTGGSMTVLTAVGSCPFRNGDDAKRADAKYDTLGSFDLPKKAKAGSKFTRQVDHPDQFGESGETYCAAAYFRDRLGRNSTLSAPIDLPSVLYDPFEFE